MPVPIAIAGPTLVADSKGTATSENRAARTALLLQLTEYDGTGHAWIYKYLPAGETDNANAVGYGGEAAASHVNWKCFSFILS